MSPKTHFTNKRAQEIVQSLIEGVDPRSKQPVSNDSVLNQPAAHDLIKNARKGDQLIVEALVCGSTVVQEYYAMQQVQFTVTAFEFGAKARNGGNASSAQAASPPPPNPTDGVTEERTIAVV